MKTAIMTTRETLISSAKAAGWKLDRFGHLKRSTADRVFRIKNQKLAWRLEKQVKVTGETQWVKLSSNYYRHTDVERMLLTIESRYFSSTARSTAKGGLK